MVIDLSTIRTEPGAGDEHPFAPPPGFDGSSDDYLTLMRRRYKEEYHPHGQRMVVAAHIALFRTPTFTGPYAKEAQRAMSGLKSSFRKEVRSE